MTFADFLTNGDHDAPPADHGAQPQSNSYHHLDPERNKAGGAVQIAFQGVQIALRVSG
ncbi:hypothetical protein D3C75_1290530 [compost metagenome]